MTLTYSFSTHMNRYKDSNEWIATYYRASILRAKSLKYKIKLYGCDFIYEQLKDIIDEFVSIEHLRFSLTDDLKIYIHSVEDLDCITIDGDIILNHRLQIPTEYDVLFDYKSRVNYRSILSVYQAHLNLFKKYNIQSEIKYFDLNTKYACNVGILKFNDIKTKNLMIDTYNKFKNYFLTHIEPYEDKNILSDPSRIICEHTFGQIVDKENLIAKFCKDYNEYKHYVGEEKFKPEFWNIVNNIIHPDIKKIL